MYKLFISSSLSLLQLVGIIVSCYMCCTVKNDDDEDDDEEENEAHVWCPSTLRNQSVRGHDL